MGRGLGEVVGRLMEEETKKKMMTHEFRQTSRADGCFGPPQKGFSTKGDTGKMGWKSKGGDSGRCGRRSRVDVGRGVLCLVAGASFLVVIAVGSEELGLLD